MNRNCRHQEKGCPPVETVCAFHDGEISHDSPEARHIAGCEACRRILEAYELIETRLRNKLKIENPEALIERVKQGVYAKLEQPVRSKVIPLYFIRAAAVFLICSVVLLYGVNSMHRGQTASRESIAVASSSPANEDMLRKFPYYTGNDNGVFPGAVTENSIPLRDFVGVNYGDSEDPVFESAQSRRNFPEKPAEIAGKVHQVWIYSDTAKADKDLKNFLNQLNVPEVNTNLTVTNNELKGNIRLTKLQLVKLVKQCSNAGFELVSPQSPQPEQKIFMGNGDSTVNYQINVVNGK